MTIIIAIILGIIQGLTEFIPISSTAHLTIAGKIFGLIDMNNPEKWTAIIAVIQMGTLFAVIFYFYKDIINIIVSFSKENFTKNRKKYAEQSLDARLGWLIIIGTLPIVLIGLILKEIIEGKITKDLFVIASSLIIVALFLAYAEKVAKLKRDIEDVKITDALIIGFAQALALIPGASRSGTSITAGLFLGLKRDTSARFSFLLSIPAIFASGVFEFFQSLNYLQSSEFLSLFISVVVSAIVGYLSIAFLLRYLRKNSTMIFVYYRIVIGLIIFSTLLIGCSSSKYFVIKDERNKIIVVGNLDWKKFQELAEWQDKSSQYYEPDKFIVEMAKKYDLEQKPIYYIFAGSWCSDSETELPKLFKVFELMETDRERIILYGVDRSKREQTGIAEKYKIERVPTLVIIQNGNELGRIVEFPKNSWEFDIYEIFNK